MTSGVSVVSRPKTNQTEWRPLLAVVFTIVAWAAAYTGIRVGLESYTPTSMALLRYLVASVILVFYVVITKMPIPAWRDLPVLALSGILGIAIYNVAVSTGEQEIPAGIASLIVAAAPIFVALLALAFLNERLRVWGWLGILVAFVGVGIISVRPEQGLQLSTGALVVLLAAVAQALYSIIQKPYLARYSPLQCTVIAIWGATLCLLWFAPEMVQQLKTASFASTAVIVLLAIFPGILGYI